MEVEVVFPQVCGAFYKATIVDFQVEEHKVLLSFEDGWKPDTWSDLDNVRFLPSTPVSDFIEPGSTVEALLPHQDNEPPGWWNGMLLKSKGELHVVEFQSGNEKYQDIVDQDKIRAPNTNEPLSKCTFFNEQFPVPDDIQSFCVKPSVHENFRKRIEAVCVCYHQEKKVLVVQAGRQECLKRASLLIDIHLRDLRTQKQILLRADMVAHREQQQQRRQLDSGVYEQQVYVASDLVGLAIGRDGHNVNEVRKLDGIMSVEFEDYNQMFRVKAKTPEVLATAKELLEITRETVIIPKNLAGRVIGKRGHVIQEILEKSGVHNIKVLGDADDDSSEKKTDTPSSSSSSSSSSGVPFDFIGRKSAVENAILMLNYHLDHLKDIESILQARKDIDGQSSDDLSLQTNFPAPYKPYGRGGRSRDRGGGANEEGGRWGEGESWGRGRRGGQGRGRGGGSGWRSRERPPPESESLEDRQLTSSSTRDKQTEKEKDDEQYYHSSEESEETEEEEEGGGENGHANGQGNSDEENSLPETDEQGPDRRRQPGAGRQQQRGGRGGGGRGRGGRGGGWRGRGRGGGRGRGRGGGGGGGYRNSRPQQQQQQREDSGTTGTTNWDSEDKDGEAAASGRGSAPKPQRPARGGGRQRNTVNNDIANTVSTENASAPDTAEQ